MHQLCTSQTGLDTTQSSVCTYRTEVCTLLLCCGADPTLVNCHSKTALDLSPTEELRQRIECKVIEVVVSSTAWGVGDASLLSCRSR